MMQGLQESLTSDTSTRAIQCERINKKVIFYPAALTGKNPKLIVKGQRN